MRKPKSHSRYAVAESLSLGSVLRNIVRAEYGTWNNWKVNGNNKINENKMVIEITTQRQNIT